MKVKMKTALLLSLIAFLFVLAATNATVRRSYLHHNGHLNASNATSGMNSTARRHHFPHHHEHGQRNASNATFLQGSDSNSTARRHHFPRHHRHVNASTGEEVNSTARRHQFPRYHQHQFPRHHRHEYDPENYSRRQTISRQRRFVNASIDEPDSDIAARNQTFTRKRRFVQFVNSSMEALEEEPEPGTNATSSETFKEVKKRFVNETLYE